MIGRRFLNRLKLRNYSTQYDVPLEWKETILSDGTAFFKHPTFETIMAVKHFRSTSEKITEEQVKQIQELRQKDPWIYTSKKLAKQFKVSKSFINLVAKEPVIKVKQDLARLKEWNQNRPKKGSRQHMNNIKIGKKIHSKKR